VTRPVVFLGPSATRDAFARLADADIWPPAAHGDIYRAVTGGARVIGLVDGVFDSVRSVWHKEILWALDQGVALLGASSMGALRAAELAPLGMQGVGWVFDAFASGRLEDDDEVALIHAPARLGFRPLSEAMVNVRRTAEQAAAEGVITPGGSEALVIAAKAQFYPDRDWPKILHEARLRPDDRQAFERWLPSGRIDIKAEDALALARALADVAPRAAGETPFRYEPTILAERARLVALRAGIGGDPDMARGAVLAEEVRLADPDWPDIEATALAEALATSRAAHLGLPLDEDALAAAIAAFRGANGLETAEAVEDWLGARRIDVNRLLETLARQVRLRQAKDELAPLAAAALQDRAWLRPDAPALMARGADKRARLARARDAAALPCDISVAQPFPADLYDADSLEAWRDEYRYRALLARDDPASGPHADET